MSIGVSSGPVNRPGRDRLLAAAEAKEAAEHISEISESIFSDMAGCASADTQRMIESVRRKTRFHFSYLALATNASGPGPCEHWRGVRAALIERNADKASQSARDILCYMQDEVARIMLARGPRLIADNPLPAAEPERKEWRCGADWPERSQRR